MTLFWALGAALAVLALAVVLRPFLLGRSAAGVSRSDANISIYRDQLRELEADRAAGKLEAADYERSRTELAARLLEDAQAQAPAGAGRRRGLGVALALAVPLGAAAIYLAVGSPGAIDAPAPQQLEAMAERLAAHLRENPDDAAGWKLLGRASFSLERFPEAADAYAKAAARLPRDASLLADFAEALAMARGRSLEGEPEQLLARALEIEPANVKALALAGTAAFARRDYVAAAAHWQKMLPLVPADSEDARGIQASIDEALALARQRPLKGVVRLSAKLKANAAPDDIVFVFARAVEGPPMPLALVRGRVRDLPLAFALDDSMAMAPGMTLSKHARVVVTARVSKAGQAAAQPGDLQGASAPVKNDADGVSVLIDSVVR